MRRLVLLLLILSLVGGACGSKKKSSDASRTGESTTTTSTSAPTAESTTTTVAAGAPNSSGTGQGAVAGSGGGGATTTTAKSSGSSSSASGDGRAAPGTYTYNRTGKSSSNAFGERSLDGPVSLKVDPANGNEQRSVQSSPEASSESVLRFLPEGAYFTYLKSTNSGLSKEFRPNPPVLAMPAGAAVGRTWSWTVQSSDGATTLNASFKVERNETVTIGGEAVPTVVLSVVLKTSGDIELTTNQTNWISVAKGLSVKVDENSNGKAGSITFSSQSSMTMTSTRPS
jgi:hypothetical protein